LPGPGWGGSCLPKDTHALLQVSDSADFEFRLLRATIDTNTRQFQRIADKIRMAITGSRQGSLRNVRIGLLGLTFKAGTGDLRDSPALAVAALLRQSGAELIGYDPALDPTTDSPALAGISGFGIRAVDEPVMVAKDADALVVLTEWPHFRSLDWRQLAGVQRRPILIDTRNLLDPDIIARAGFSYYGLGTRPRLAGDSMGCIPSICAVGHVSLSPTSR
jgi:UDPglucose 6-dehydrogenase